jgi:ribosomal protein S18 acetylase RimI-like enzyme
LYGATAFFTGMMMGAITGARRGYQIGKIIPAAKLGYFAAAYNPFVEPKGSRHKQAIDLKVEETLFHLFETQNAKRILIQNLDERFQIRFAKKEDVGLILNFIKELAAHEKILSDVVATEATLKETLFGEKPKAEVLLGYLDEKPVSFLIFYPNYFSVLATPGLFIENLYIQQSYRGYGLGARMLAFLANLALERDCKRLDWFVSHRNVYAKEFYDKIGAKPLKNWTTYRLEGEVLQKLARRAR